MSAPRTYESQDWMANVYHVLDRCQASPLLRWVYWLATPTLLFIDLVGAYTEDLTVYPDGSFCVKGRPGA